MCQKLVFDRQIIRFLKLLWGTQLSYKTAGGTQLLEKYLKGSQLSQIFILLKIEKYF